MIITSVRFLFFCVGAFLLFVIFPKKWRWISLLISSFIFYSLAAAKMVPFILFTSLTIWWIAKKIEFISNNEDKLLTESDISKEEKREIKKKNSVQRKRWLLLALVLNVGVLVVCKIFGYFAEGYTTLVNVLTGIERADISKFIIPVGISYYTFSTVGYLLDVYWKRYKCEQNPFRFALYTIYFPHILQGPISRYSSLGMQLKKKELSFTWPNFVVGMESILLGCFKKLVIADRIAIIVSDAYYADNLPGVAYLMAMILDAIQIYTDFSGYMDIVSGVSTMFDVELEKNFNHPFLANNVPDFWRRWHMTLGGWFKDYVYYPLTVSKWSKKIYKKTSSWNNKYMSSLARVAVPIIATWLLTGIWHGTGIGYVCWGVYYGVWILLSVLFYDDVQMLLKKCGVKTECFSWRVLRVAKIFCIFVGGRFLGQALSFTHRMEMVRALSSLSSFWGSYSNYGLTIMNLMIIIGGVILLFAIAAIETKGNSIYIWFNAQNSYFRITVVLIMFFLTFMFGIYGNLYDTSKFMYQNF